MSEQKRCKKCNMLIHWSYRYNEWRHHQVRFDIEHAAEA